MVVPHSWADPYALLTRPPLPTIRRWLLARLACVRPAASVRSEPGSNSHVTVRTRHTPKEVCITRHKSRPSILKLASDARTKAYQSTNGPITPTAHPFLKNTLCQRTTPKTAELSGANSTARPRTSVVWARLIRPLRSAVKRMLTLF